MGKICIICAVTAKATSDMDFKAYDNADQFGADKTRYAISGGSAGAALAIAVAHKLVSTGQGGHICGLISVRNTWT